MQASARQASNEVSPAPQAKDIAATAVASRSRVLLVDDRPDRRALMRMVVETGERGGRVVAEATSSATAVAALEAHAVDAAIVEIQLPIAAGMATIAALRADRPGLVIVVCSFRADTATRLLAETAGADAYLEKPVSSRDLQAACSMAHPRPESLTR